jgi:hypothetical protein
VTFSLKLIHKYLLYLTAFFAIILLSGYLFISAGILRMGFIDILISASVFSFIAFITLLTFFKGQSKEPDGQTLYILVAISLKFLLDITFALLWFIVAKKTYLESVLMFFVLYLALTLFSVFVILKTLKNKAL